MEKKRSETIDANTDLSSDTPLLKIAETWGKDE